MKKALSLLALALLVLPVYAVLINLSSDKIDRIGGTGKVDVQGPGTVSEVEWTLTEEPPYQVDKVAVIWDAEEDNSGHMVYVTIYDNTGSAIASGGSEPNQRGSGEITTIVDVTPNVDPQYIYKVEIIIVEE
ncbi:MAG: hypothetical protein QXO15_04385 [Nitrososphaerota archaeon]